MFFESFWLNFTIASGLIIALTFDYVTKFFSYWYVRHIPYKPSIPFFGSDYHRVLGIKSTTEEVTDLYNKFPKEDFVGSVKSRIPDLIVRNPDLIKEVLSTEFESFKSRGLDLDKSQDICLRNNLFYAEGEKWTVLRAELDSLLNDVTLDKECFLQSLSGTNGNINVQCLLTKVLDVAFKNLLVQDGDGSVISELREAFAKRSIKDKLFSYLKNIFPSVYVLFSLSTVFGQPSKKAKKALANSTFSKNIESIFKDNMMKIRTKPEHLSFEILASIVSEGYIPCLNLLTAVVYELSKNKGFQSQARTSDDFLNAVIDETMRLYPPFAVITRKCVKTYKFAQSKVLVDRGVTINIPVGGIHKDESYYKEPEAFKPERFLEGASEHGYAFIPYGVGPRRCIGEKLSREVIFSVAKAIVKNFDIEPSETNPSKLSMADHNFGRVVDGDIWLRFKPLKNNLE